MAELPDIDEDVLNYQGKSIVDYLDEINSELQTLVNTENKELKEAEKPDGIVNRIFVDLFGILGLYLMLFVLCDLTRLVITGGELYGIKWIFWGPYYYFTEAPLLTRIWKSKKFLEDLADFDRGEHTWPNERNCLEIGADYRTGCDLESTSKKHPIRDHLGSGLDWIIKHVFSGDGTIGKFLDNSTCEEQGDTIAHLCARERVQAAYDCYHDFCNHYDLQHIATIDQPNTPGDFENQTVHWDFNSTQAYVIYYNIYTAIYDIGYYATGSDGVPSNLSNKVAPSDAYNYCYDPTSLFLYDQFRIPSWYPFNPADPFTVPDHCWYQNNYKQHLLDYWD